MDESDTGVQPLALNRSRREKKDKHGRSAAFDRLRKLKGAKNKYEVSDVDNVYEEVDEREYSERVLQRQEDEFIVDDDGAGYAEDGREIFDEDIYMGEEEAASRSKDKASGRGRKRAPNDEEHASGEKSKRPKSGDIRKLISNIAHIPSKKKTEVKKLEEDNDLQEILKELESTPLDNVKNRSLPDKQFSAMSAKDYLKTFAPVQHSRNVESLSPPRKIVIHKARNSTPRATKRELNHEPEIRPTPVRIKREITEHNLDQYDDLGDVIDDYSDFHQDDVINNEILVKSEPKDDAGKEVSKPVGNSNDVIEKEMMLTDELSDFGDIWHEKMEEESITKDNKPTPVDVIKKEPDNFESGWESMLENVEKTQAVNVSVVDTSKLPLIETESKDKFLYFYYLDAHDEYFQQPGTVFLFGKVWDENSKAFHSCCVTVKDIERKIFILPREERINPVTQKTTGLRVSMQDVYEEFDRSISNLYKILKYKCRSVTKNYAFNLTDVPVTSEYLEVRYSAQYPKLPFDLQGETFSRAFGMNRSFVEQLLVDKKIKGPRWLAIKNPTPVSNQMTWCRYEVTCNEGALVTAFGEGSEHSSLSDRPPPPLTVLTLCTRVVYTARNSNSEFVCVAGLVSNNFPLEGAPPKQPFQQHFCAVTKLSDRPWPLNMKTELARPEVASLKLEKCDSERALLNYLMARYYRIDPDLIVCHDFADGDLNLLIKKVIDMKIANWSRLGRLKRAKKPWGGRAAGVAKAVMCGRLVCDMKTLSRELVRARAFDLDTLCCQLLHFSENQRDSYTPDEVRNAFSDIGTLIKLLKATVLDATYILRLMCELNALPLALQITNIAGNVLSRTLSGGKSERNEFLLLHAFEDKGYIVPEKEYQKTKGNAVLPEELDDLDVATGPSGGVEGASAGAGTGAGRSARRKPAYAGGLVLEPKRGLYDRLVLLMDFNSLYPSIIQEYNICYTTVDRQEMQQDDISSLPLPGPDVKPGVLPSEIRQLVESRRVVKRMMANPNISSDQRMQYEIRQLALKLMANSMYGCLGFAQSRFCCKPLAALVTAKGREILMRTKELVESLGYEVVYGDTDSLMINTNTLDYSNVKKIGLKIKAEVNRHYKQLELDIDGIFRCLLLCKKKKYAASVIVGQLPDGSLQTKQEIKGLDVVRRDWCRMSSEAGKFILAQILSEQESDERVANIHKHLGQLRDDLEAGRVPLSLLTIGKQLAKEVVHYGQNTTLPHVLVASRANQRSHNRFKAGDVVHYVICQDGTTNSATQRAYLVEELKTNESLKIDINYYLEQQVLPVISRICEPIHGAEPARIAQSLGIDYSKLEKTESSKYDEDNSGPPEIVGPNKFENCEKFTFNCVKCGSENIMEGPTKLSDIGVEILSLNRCSNPDCGVQPKQYLASIRNRLALQMRSFMSKYYKGVLVCEDRYCQNKTRRVVQNRRRGQPLCESCVKLKLHNFMKPEYTDYELYTQLVFLQTIFDLSRVPPSIRIDPEVQTAYNLLQDDVRSTLKLSAYAFVNLTNLFYLLTPFAVKKTEKP